MNNKIINIDSLIHYNDKINQIKQDVLVSGVNIKTINGESIVGSGDITISSGNSNANVQAVDTGDVIDDVNTNTYVKYVAQTLTEEQKAQARENIGVESVSSVQPDWNENDTTSDAYIKNKPDIQQSGDGTGFLSNDGTYKSIEIPVVIDTATNVTIKPNTYYIFAVATQSLNITLETPTNTGVLNNYMFEFSTNNEPSLTLPSSIKWINDEAPVLESNNTYQVSIINDLATIAKYSLNLQSGSSD